MPGFPGTVPAPELPPGPRLALVIATSAYDDPGLRQLLAPAHDAAALAQVLADPEVGGFTVTSVADGSERDIRLAVEDFLADRGTQDLLLVYLSCHGLLDEHRRLFFAARDTRKDRLAATGVEAAWVLEQLEDCRARRQVLILDSCFSGAFARGAKGDTDVGLRDRFAGHGRGRMVLTASTATQYSFEGDPVDPGAAQGSVFTAALVAGLRTGAADADGDGFISVDDAYAYAFEQVKARRTAQTPQRWLYGAEGSIILARSPAGRVMPLAPLSGPAPQQARPADQPLGAADILIPRQHIPARPGADDDRARPARGPRRRPVLIAAGTGIALAVVLATVLLILPGGNSVSPGSAASYAQVVLADHPVAYWQFEAEPGSAGYADSSGNGNTLPTGLTTLAAPGTPDLAGAISTAGGGTYTTTSLRPLVGDASRTVESWFRTTATGCIFNAGLDAHTQAFTLCLRDGPVNVPTPGAPGIYFATYDADIFIPVGNLTDGTWHYLAVTLTKNMVDIVIDGTDPNGYIWDGNAHMPGGGAYSRFTTQPFTLPYTPDTAATPLGVATAGIGGIAAGLLGTIAEVAIYPSALPVSKLFRHYQLVAG